MDISFAMDLMTQQTQLQKITEELSSFFELIPEPLCIIDMSGHFIKLNQAWERILGHRWDTLKDCNFTDFMHEDDQLSATQQLQRLQQGKNVTAFVSRYRTQDGTYRFMEWHAAPALGKELIYAAGRDITQRLEHEQQLQAWDHLLGHIILYDPNAIAVHDKQLRYIYVSERYLHDYGVASTDIIGRSHYEVFPDIPQKWRDVHQRALNGEVIRCEEDCFERLDGRLDWTRWECRPWFDHNGEIGGIVLYTEVITAHKEVELALRASEARLAQLAHYDTLTDLPNRILGQQRLQDAIDLAAYQQQHFAVLFIDLDRFKHVNDSLGHPTGDELLRAIGKRLRTQLRPSDTLARLGGDEFLLIQTPLGNATDAATTAQAILDCLKQVFQLHSHYEIYVSASIGISLYPNDAQSVASLIQHADAAMYQAKSQGRNTYHFYTQALTDLANRRLDLEMQLHRALEHDAFSLHYQPIVCAHDARIIGLEALLRWQTEDGQHISPADFIPICEDNGLIIPLGQWVLKQACTQAANWRKQTHCQPFTLSVNLSACQFRMPDMPQRIHCILEETGWPAQDLELELTESVIMQHGSEALKMLDEFKKLGIRIAIDDFGTGYSSLAYLKQFKVDRLKIDRQFVRYLETDEDDRAIVATIITMAHNLQLTIVAEGVETQTQYELIKQMGGDALQGYLFSPPKPPQVIASMLYQTE